MVAGGQRALRKRPCVGRPAERGRGTRGDEDVQMAAEAETGGHTEDVCSLIDFKCPSCGEGDFDGEEEEAFSEIL